MSLSRKDVRARLSKECRAAGHSWSKHPEPEFDWQSCGYELNLLAYTLSENISDSHPDWVEAFAYNEPFFILRDLAAWDARKWRNQDLVRTYNAVNQAKLNVEDLKGAFVREIRHHELLNSRGGLDESVVNTILTSLQLVIADNWAARGGRAPGQVAVLFSLLMIESSLMYLDPTTAVWFDDNGLPTMTGKDTSAAIREQVHSEGLPLLVQGRLDPVPTAWSDFDVNATLSEIIERAVQMIKFANENPDVDDTPEVDIAESQRMHPKPPAVEYGISPLGAEQWVCDWMLWMGAGGAETTQYVQDGGLDVVGDYVAAQVKLYTGSVSVNEVRELVGATRVNVAPRLACFFTSGSYTQSALEYGKEAYVAMFYFDASAGEVIGANELGARFAAEGFWNLEEVFADIA